MNIYLFEMKAQLKSLVVWTAVILLLLIAFMAGIYPVFYKSLDDVLAMLSGFPPEFAAAFGLNAANLFSYSGFFNFTFMYMSLLGAIMAVAVAVSAFAREKRSKCVDFLLTKPRNRGGIFAAKLLSSLTVIAVANAVFVAAAVALYVRAGQDSSLTGRFILAACGLFFTQLVFLTLGILWAVSVKKVRSVSGIATAFGFAGFILSALASILEEEAVRFIAPLEYFHPAAVFSVGGYETKYVVAAVVVIAVCMVLSCIKFCRCDAPAA